MVDKAQIKEWYGNGLTDAQLDGKGAKPGSTYAARNYVALGVITQIEASEMRGASEPHADAQHNLKSGVSAALPAKAAVKSEKQEK